MRRLPKTLLNQIIIVSTTVVVSVAAAGEVTREPGVLLRSGEWGGGVGTYHIPNALNGAKPAEWPIDGWVRLTFKANYIEREKVVSPTGKAGKTPAFLKSIIEQVERGESGEGQMNAVSDALVSQAADAGDILYLRVPGVDIKPGRSLLYMFKNGTPSLRPKLDYRYELALGEQKFAFTVQNGLRTKTGAAYGEGAQYTIEYDGKTFEYSLGQFGWDSTITAITDIDGDGKPDFIINVGGNNSGYEAVLLSSTAKPGKNLPTASLTSTGC